MKEENPEKIIHPQELERSILRGLSREWQKALWILPPDQRRRMRPPLFALQDMEDKWGTWSGEKRLITLSRRLVFYHPWDAVCEVLLHEMAHQMAEEVLQPVDGSAHGPQFQRACRSLRANPRAAENYPTLDERVLQEDCGPGDKILQRVKKLMALAQSSNPHEAQAAMAKAHQLIARHNLDLLSREEDRDFNSIFLGRPALRHPREDYSLAHLLQDFYFVQGTWISAFVLEKGKMGRVLEISGTNSNLRMAGYVYDCVRRYIHTQWAAYNQGKNLNRYRRTDFAVGIVEGFRSKLESGQEGTPAIDALVKREDPLLTKYLAYRYPHTVKIRGRVGRRDRQVWGDGRRAGRKMIIARGITENRGNRGRLIAPST